MISHFWLVKLREDKHFCKIAFNFNTPYFNLNTPDIYVYKKNDVSSY